MRLALQMDIVRKHLEAMISKGPAWGPVVDFSESQVACESLLSGDYTFHPVA